MVYRMVSKGSQLTLDSFTKKAKLEAKNVISERSSKNGWIWVRLGDFVETTSGGTPLRSRKEYFGGNIPWVKSGELEDNWIFSTEETITEEGLRNSNAKIFPKGTLLVAMYGATVGKTAILGVDAATNQAVCAIFPKKDLIDPFFIRYFIIWKRDELIKSSFGGAQPNISQTVIRNLMIPLPFKDGKPDIEEQRRVVARVEEITAKIEQAKKLREDALKETEKIMQTALHQIFSKPEQKGWVVKTLGEISKNVRYGLTAKSTTTPEGVLYIRITDIDSEGNLKLSDPHYVKIDAATAEKYSLNNGDILIARSGATAGKAYLCEIKNKAVFASYMIRFRLKDDIVMPKFVFYFLQSPIYWEQLQMNKIGGAQPNVNAKNLQNIKIPVPPIEQQQRIVTYLDDLKKQVSLLKKYQIETEEKFNLMVETVLKMAFSGKL